jgi:transposase InsO family protein
MRQGQWEQEEVEVETEQEADEGQEEKYVWGDVTAAVVLGAYLKKPGSELGAEKVGDVSDVPSPNSVEVDVKEWAAEVARGVEYWEEVKMDQRRDKQCAEWVKKLNEKGEVKQEGGTMELDEQGVLHLRDKQGRLRLAIPSGQKREELLRLVHENPRDGGHFGAVKGASKLQQRWWWPGMVADLRHWVSTCRVCQVYKHARGRGKLPRDTPRVVPAGPWDSVYVDAIGPLSMGNGGYRYCLVAIDHFTRFVEILPARRLTTESYVGWLQQLIARYGTMKRLTSDRGSNFVSALVDAYCKMMGISRHSTTAWRPTANSLVERYNGELKDRMRTMSEEVGKDWPRMMDDFAGVHNTTVHSATGFTPFFLMHGWEAKLPYDLLVEGKDAASGRPLDMQQWVERFVRLVSDSRSAARHQQGDRDRKRQLREVILAKTANPPPVFRPGQEVLVDKKHRNFGEKKERTVIWEGPFTVLRQTGEVTYLIERANGREDMVHVDRMKRYNTPRTDGVRLTRRSVREEETKEEGVLEESKTGFEDLGEGVAQDEDVRGDEFSRVSREAARLAEEEEGVFAVEQLMQKRVSGSGSKLAGPQIEYLVKWKNWDDTHNSWEKLENLGAGCQGLISDFDRAELVRARASRALRRGDLAECGLIQLGQLP